MTSIADGTVIIQTSAESALSTPSWFGEVTVMAAYLRKYGVLTKISERVRFARRRFGRYDVIDFLAVLFGYAISGERTVEAFYERLQPFAVPFMALFGRDQLRARSTLSRFLAALTPEPVEALRMLFLDDLLSRPLTPDKQTGGLTDRVGNAWVVFDIDGTREAARQRALPQTEDLPSAFRRLDEVCAPGYKGRKRGQVVRTRTTISQAHSYHWLGSFGNRGNGQYRVELRQGLAAITRYLTAHQLPQACALLRLDGQYGAGAVLADLAGFTFVTRGKEYSVLDHPLIQARLHLPPDQFQQRTAKPDGSQSLRLPTGGSRDPKACCVAWWWPRILRAKRRAPLVSRVQASSTNSSLRTCRSTLSAPPMSSRCTCIVALLSRRSRMKIRRLTLIAGAATRPGDRKLGSAWLNRSGTSAWSWVITFILIRYAQPSLLLLSHLHSQTQPLPSSGYAPPAVGSAWKAGRFSGHDFTLQPDGTLRCPANQELRVQEQRREIDGSLRVVYAASIRSCRPCPLREQCQWQGGVTKKPRQVSVLLHPLVVGDAPLLWQDWSRRVHRRACIQLFLHQRVEVQVESRILPPPVATPSPLSRAARAHSRLSWQERLARNARMLGASQITIKVFGVPPAFAAFLSGTGA